MSRYFIIHGTQGNPNENWFPWLTEKLTKKGKEVIVPSFPILENQSYDNWSKLLMYYYDLGLIDDDTVFICHSIATIFICKFLIKHKTEVKAIISVSGFNSLLNSEFDKYNKTFLLEEKDFSKLGKYVKYMYCFYSDNDPYIPREELENFVRNTNGAKCLIKGAGHFNAESNYKQFPQMLESIEKMEKEAFKKELL